MQYPVIGNWVFEHRMRICACIKAACKKGKNMNELYGCAYKMEVNWSALVEGLTLPVESRDIFGRIKGRQLRKGEHKEIAIYLNGKSYGARIYNQNIEGSRILLQIRYPRNGELAKELQKIFFSSYNFISNARKMIPKGTRVNITLPDGMKEYIAIYTTEFEDTYEFETIQASDMDVLRKDVAGKSEYEVELDFSIDMKDSTSKLVEMQRTSKIRKLNRKIGELLKIHYGYRCQICGRVTGEEYGAHIAEAHHIDYFVNSLNNDASNQMILCPNHHRIIHELNPEFDRKNLKYIYPNGYEEKLIFYDHLINNKR